MCLAVQNIYQSDCDLWGQLGMIGERRDRKTLICTDRSSATWEEIECLIDSVYNELVQLCPCCVYSGNLTFLLWFSVLTSWATSLSLWIMNQCQSRVPECQRVRNFVRQWLPVECGAVELSAGRYLYYREQILRLLQGPQSVLVWSWTSGDVSCWSDWHRATRGSHHPQPPQHVKRVATSEHSPVV